MCLFQQSSFTSKKATSTYEDYYIHAAYSCQSLHFILFLPCSSGNPFALSGSPADDKGETLDGDVCAELALAWVSTLALANVYSSSCSDVWHSNSVVLPNTVYRGTSTCSPGALIAAQSLNKGWSQSKQRLVRHQSPFEGWLGQQPS